MRLLWNRSRLASHHAGKSRKLSVPRIDRALERADRRLVVVARIDHRHVGRRDQVVPVLRIDIGAHDVARIGPRHAHGDDLALQPHLHPAEGHLGRGAFLPFQIGAARKCADMRQHRVDALPCPRDGPIDPFRRDQQRAANPMRLANCLQGRPKHVRVLEPRELVKRGDGQHERGPTRLRAPAQAVGCAIMPTDRRPPCATRPTPFLSSTCRTISVPAARWPCPAATRSCPASTR